MCRTIYHVSFLQWVWFITIYCHDDWEGEKKGEKIEYILFTISLKQQCKKLYMTCLLQTQGNNAPPLLCVIFPRDYLEKFMLYTQRIYFAQSNKMSRLTYFYIIYAKYLSHM